MTYFKNKKQKLDFTLIWKSKKTVTTEGPQWDGTGFIFSCIQESVTRKFVLNSGDVKIFRKDTNMANGAMYDRYGNYFVCEGANNSHALVRYTKKEKVVLVENFEGKRLNMPNDLAIGQLGILKDTIFFTDPWYEGVGGSETQTRQHMELDGEFVYRLTPQDNGKMGVYSKYSLQRVVSDTTRPNGILLSKDESVLYVAQSGRLPEEEKNLRAYVIKEDGSLGNTEILYDFKPNRGIDGMKLDKDGAIWATAGSRMNTEKDASGLPPGPKIIKFSPKGEVLCYFPLPEPVVKPTNCAFGGPNLNILMVTTGLGHTYIAETNTIGLVAYCPQIKYVK